jgi:tRNA(adenine34) deaminase
MTEGPAFSEADVAWMKHALALAHRAEAEGEVPVGAVVIDENGLVAEGWNLNISLADPTAHAEIVAMREASRARRNHRLPGCELYVTLEPCAMCVGAAIHARIARIVFGAPDPKTGALGGAFQLAAIETHNHKVAFSGGLLQEQCGEVLRRFFRARRSPSGAG